MEQATRLQARQSDGATLRQHLQAAANATGQPDPLLTLPPVPAGCQGLMAAFAELSAARPLGLGAAGAIPPSEIAAWCALHGVRLTSWELDTLSAIDRACLATSAQSQS